MIEHIHHVRVRYGETDQMGYLYHGQYAAFYELGRVELLRAFGLSYRDLEEVHGIGMPVVNMQMRFLRPARYDVQVAVHTQIRRMPGRDIVFHYELRDETGKLLNGARVSLCFVQRASGQRLDCPAILHQLLAPHFA